MYYGDYKFIVDLDTGAETGANQRTVWVAEKVNIEAVSLSKFRIDQLLKALTEPLQSHLHKKLEEEKLECRRPFEEAIAELYGSLQVREDKKGKRLPGKVKRRVRNLRKQMNIAIQRLEADFRQRELLSLEERHFDQTTLQSESRVFKAEEHLRSFYFEEANDTHIHNFCRKFALDADYRQEVLAGETHWVKRDELFVRNLLAILGEDSLFANADDYDRKAHDLFHWFDTHVEEILALPEYQRLQEIDSPFQPDMDEIDPLIRPAVEALNRIPGVTTQFSCQGVSGKVRFQGRDLLVVSPHEEYAFVSFSELRQSAHDAIAALLPMFPSITNAHIPCNFALCSLLRSTGDNLRFREELVTLAEHVLKSVDENWSTQPRRDETLYRKEGVYAVQFPRTSAPGGILPARRVWLCQPEQIERTLHLLFHLNHWAKARDHFLYAERNLVETRTKLILMLVNSLHASWAMKQQHEPISKRLMSKRSKGRLQSILRPLRIRRGPLVNPFQEVSLRRFSSTR
jgi:hypothetical protein